MNADIDIQVVWNESKCQVLLFIGDFRIGLPPALCEQLENELASARRIPERARAMCNHESGTLSSTLPGGRINEVGGDVERKSPVAAHTPFPTPEAR